MYTEPQPAHMPLLARSLVRILLGVTHEVRAATEVEASWPPPDIPSRVRVQSAAARPHPLTTMFARLPACEVVSEPIESRT